jgi:hypothetical protein
MLSQVSVPSAAEPAAAAGDDIEAEVAELITAMRKSQSPVTGDRMLPSHSGSSSGSFMSSRPSSNSRGSIDRALLLSVVGPACSVSQTTHANSPPPVTGDNGERVDASNPGVTESRATQNLTPAAAQVAAIDVSEAVSEVGHSARPSAPRSALEFKWMLWTGSAYEPFSNAAHDLIEKSLRAFEMRVVIDLSTGQGHREGFNPGQGLKLFVNPVGRTAYFYDEISRKKVRRIQAFVFESDLIHCSRAMWFLSFVPAGSSTAATRGNLFQSSKVKPKPSAAHPSSSTTVVNLQIQTKKSLYICPRRPCIRFTKSNFDSSAQLMIWSLRFKNRG